MEGASTHGKATVNRAASVSSATGLMVRNSVELMKNVLSTTPHDTTQVPPPTPASNAESPAAAMGERNGSSSNSDGKSSRMLSKRQSTTESAVSTSEMLCDSLLAGWDPEREAVDLNGGVIVENGDESGQVAKATAPKVPMPFSRIATNLEELQKVLPILDQSINVHPLVLTRMPDQICSCYPASTSGA